MIKPTSTKTTLSLLATGLFSAQVSAFWEKGHYLVTRQAQTYLEEERPDVFEAINELLMPLKADYPDLTVSEKDHPFVESATLADIMVAQGQDWQFPWHFIDTPLFEPGKSEKDFDVEMASQDAVGALTDLSKFLKGEVSLVDSEYVQTIAQYYPRIRDQKSLALRLIIHYCGDIHQPLHTVSAYSIEYPLGDRGGNSEKVIPAREGVENLHSIWDSVIYQYPGYQDMPFNQESWEYFTQNAGEIMAKYPQTTETITDDSFKEWAHEGFEIAKADVYPDFKENRYPTKFYRERALPILEKRMAQGGRRMADLLISIFDGQRKQITFADLTSNEGFLQ